MKKAPSPTLFFSNLRKGGKVSEVDNQHTGEHRAFDRLTFFQVGHLTDYYPLASNRFSARLKNHL